MEDKYSQNRPMTEIINLVTVNTQVNPVTAQQFGLDHINLEPSFQRNYDAWTFSMKVRLIETMLVGFDMNGIWLTHNDKTGSDDVLDGKHRLSTCLAFYNNEFMLSSKHFKFMPKKCRKKYHGKKFSNLDEEDKAKIKKYKFRFTNVGIRSIDEIRYFYEMLNRSSVELNDYEYDKGLYKPFYDIITSMKHHFIGTKMFKKIPDKRGKIDALIIELFILSKDVPQSWCSVKDLRRKWFKNNMGEDEKSVSKYIRNNSDMIQKRLKKIYKMILVLQELKFFTVSGEVNRTNILDYKIMVGRCAAKILKISLFREHAKSLINTFNTLITHENIVNFFKCRQRNAQFQKKYISHIDGIIKTEIGTVN